MNDASPPPPASPDLAPNPARALGLPEFVAMLALIFATTALSIDAMLPVLPQIAAELSPGDANLAQLVLPAFAVGLGIGTILAGPLSDWLGRKPAMTLGFVVYILAAIAAALAPSMETLLASRVVMGFGLSAPRIAGMALVRDLYAGREMARIISFVMTVFMVVPALAPMMGEAIAVWGGWRAIFASFVLFGLVGAAWLNIRQPETLPVAARRRMSLRVMLDGAREVLSERQIVLCTIAISLGFGQLFAMLTSAQQLWAAPYGRAENFALWFAALAVLSTFGTIANARLVMRVGMRRIINTAYAGQCLASALFLALLAVGLPAPWDYAVFFVWAVGLMGMAGLTFGNLNALAMQSKGHIAGVTASVISAISTLVGAVLGGAVGQMYDGSAVPLVASVLLTSVAALMVTRRLSV